MSATLASPRSRPAQPDLVRIAALSVAMAVNVTVFIAASRPLPPLPMLRTAAAKDLGVRFIDPPKPAEIPPPPPLNVQPLHHPPTHALPASPPVATSYTRTSGSAGGCWRSATGQVIACASITWPSEAPTR